jgi:hypothetical protein
MSLAEGDLIFRHLSRPRHDEQRVAVLLDFWLLMGVRRVLNRQRMQMELGRDASEQPVSGSCKPIQTTCPFFFDQSPTSSIGMSATRRPFA